MADVRFDTPALGAAPADRWELRLPGNRLLQLGGRPRVMGIINVTPDSFSDGGLFLDSERAVAHGLAMLEQGADCLDLGAESTRPGGGVYGAGAVEVTAEQELERHRTSVFFVECSPKFVEELNQVVSFTGQGRVLSAYAPYTCPECNANRDLENEANCSSNVDYVDGKTGGKACVPPSG